MEPVFVHGESGSLTLLASRSRRDGQAVFPRLPATSPAAALYDDVELTGPAKLYSYTVIHPNPKSGQKPFVLALVDFAQGARVFGRLDMAPDQVRIGMAVGAVPAEGPEGQTYRFAPLKGN
ncbi:hypothetical protein GCM10011326_40000 [Salipiger profundus]|nr:hypothetical protein GCM10011326_40000 [Salipiger profundus]